MKLGAGSRPFIDPSAERPAAELSPATFTKAEWMLTTFVFPHIGSRPIGEIGFPRDIIGYSARTRSATR